MVTHTAPECLEHSNPNMSAEFALEARKTKGTPTCQLRLCPACQPSLRLKRKINSTPASLVSALSALADIVLPCVQFVTHGPGLKCDSPPGLLDPAQTANDRVGTWEPKSIVAFQQHQQTAPAVRILPRPLTRVIHRARCRPMWQSRHRSTWSFDHAVRLGFPCADSAHTSASAKDCCTATGTTISTVVLDRKRFAYTGSCSFSGVSFSLCRWRLSGVPSLSCSTGPASAGRPLDGG